MEKNPSLNELFPLPDGARRLQVFVGDWKVEGTLTFEGKPLKVKGTWKISSAAAGWGVLNVGRMELEGMGKYEEVDILGFNPGEKLVHLFSLTNTAAVHDHKGRWSDDTTLNFVYEGSQEGKKYREEITVKFHSPKEWSINELDSLDGQIISTMEITLRK